LRPMRPKPLIPILMVMKAPWIEKPNRSTERD